MQNDTMNNKVKRKMHKALIIGLYMLLILICVTIGASIGILGGNHFSNIVSQNNKNSSNEDSSDTISSNIISDNSSTADTYSAYIGLPKTASSINSGVDRSDISSMSSLSGFSSEVLVDSKPIVDFKRDYDLSFPTAYSYSQIEGVTCFRGNNYRDSASYGYVDMKEYKLETVWSKKIGYIDIWTGVGWTGQPAIVKWSDEVKNISNISSAKKKKADLKEVIYATLDGNIYFLDLDDGSNTRSPIKTGVPHKGSVMIDPRGYPLLYAGQGIPEVAGKKVPIGYRIYSLINQQKLYFINGMDKDAKRYWGAFDSGALVDASSDTFIECGENGILYSGKLNTVFNPAKKTISINPELVKYRYTSPISSKIGIENSPVIYKDFIYFADNNGLFQCVNLNTLKTVWTRDVTDDTDSTPVLEEETDGVFIYTACEMDHHTTEGASYIRKLDAANGELIWELKVPCVYDEKTNGGALATPVVGKNDISGLVIFNIAKTPKENSSGNSKIYGGKLLAIDKKTGKEVWTQTLDYYCWSSPVAVYDKNGKSCLIVCDSGGRVNLLEGTTGKVLDSISLGANIEASPAVYDNMIVIGTRGSKIWGIKIK